jgi:hypothetical protein
LHHQRPQLQQHHQLQGDPVPGDPAEGPDHDLGGGGGACPDQPQCRSGRLAKKLNKQVFVSYNVADDMLTTPQVIERLVDEIKKLPEKF